MMPSTGVTRVVDTREADTREADTRVEDTRAADTLVEDIREVDTLVVDIQVEDIREVDTLVVDIQVEETLDVEEGTLAKGTADTVAVIAVGIMEGAADGAARMPGRLPMPQLKTGDLGGFAFVRYKYAHEAQKAMEKLYGSNQETGLLVSIQVHDSLLTCTSTHYFQRVDTSKGALNESTELELPQNFQGKSEVLEMVGLFSYRLSTLIEPDKVAALRCAAEFLEGQSMCSANWILENDNWVLETRNKGEICDSDYCLLCKQMGTLKEDSLVLGEY
ncbi:hypothetical protein HHK36_003370 [Tetracentron sinense]|uniref:RRM domain-containing protein n=1 Tax=Tetracentron sinense TaxID=13715 RepID=A0A835DNK8_TETSI|nr:hypothetical protein HHK36_003370 [Tetracentron sinense]